MEKQLLNLLVFTPVCSIIGYIQLLDSSELTTYKKEHYLKIIKNKSTRLQALVNDFFELSVIDSVDYQLNLHMVKINHLAWETLVVFYDQFSEKKMEPSIHIQNEDIQIIADESAVKRVMENLIYNTLNHASCNISITLQKQKASYYLSLVTMLKMGGSLQAKLKDGQLHMICEWKIQK
ncbi:MULTISPECIES: histidine kinase dimerization/phospho-acceptor domain-containing protein [Bacillus]|uniref:histidine kinase dimerization/phospho-acceptor domain-containing protein n=1 Tax=Bacillus TaxID=1386 RepID=UPI0020D230B2|nr:MULTISPECIES: histidine kinase dimerization/phospho-acceptor domain-containing protein [Bacillus]MCX2828972.1 sensor histidine kinase [Bacillus sp. DHT2]MDR4916989.1 sensor histidine kinase [Bacillus pseudomycoides]